MLQRLKLVPKTEQQRQLILSQEMKQALHILPLSALELQDWLYTKIEQNPLLEIIPPKKELSKTLFKEKNLLFKTDKSFIEKATLYDHLLTQAKYTFSSSEEIRIAKHLIGSIDSKGFLSLSIEDLAKEIKIEKQVVLSVLQIVQHFDPIGICSRSLQECFLIQLEAKDKKESLTAKIIKMHFQDLLKNKISFIAKELSIPLQEISRCLEKDFFSLYMRPAMQYIEEPTHPLVIDVEIRKEKKLWEILIDDSMFPTCTIRSDYLALYQKGECKEFFKPFIHEANWTQKILSHRKGLLEKMALFLIKTQKDFFENSKNLSFITIKDLAKFLDVHESTASRAIANKYIKTPRGILPFRYFFSSISIGKDEKISNKTAKELLKKLIQEEDKEKPLSDKDLAEKLIKKGISCSRRTVTKYRKKMLIGSSLQRKQY